MSVLRPIMKMTAVTVTYRNRKHTEFINCRYEDGKAVISQERLDKILTKLGVRRGETYSIG